MSKMIEIQISKVDEIISQKNEQGQIISICCYNSAANKAAIDSLSLQPNTIYFVDAFESGESEPIAYLDRIKENKPDFLIVFSGENELIDMTAFIYEWGGKHILVGDEVANICRKVTCTVIPVNKEIVFDYSGEEVKYKADYITKVEQYWDFLKKSGKTFYNGIMYSVCNYEETLNRLCFKLAKTNYKHMIYSKEHDFRNEFHTCTTAAIAIIETSDGYSVLGKMSKESAFSCQYKCVGGALDESDVDGNKVNIQRFFSREILEELGIDITDNNICCSNEYRWLLIREKMSFIGLCNVIKLRINKMELNKRFQQHRETDDEKEIDSLLFVKSMNEIDLIPDYEKADYVDELYSCYFGVTKGMSWEKYKDMYNGELFT